MKTLLVLVSFLVAQMSFANTSLNTTEATPTSFFENLATTNSELYRYLEMESQTRYVSEAIQIKESALRYVYDMYDFEIISRSAFPNPSQAYKQAVGDFITRHIGRYMNSVQNLRDLEMVLKIEGRTLLVSQAKMVKEAALSSITDENGFEMITRNAFTTPSEAYRQMIGEFIPMYVGRALHSYSRLRIILQLESRTIYVRSAIAVKEAGLVAVHTRYDLYDLSRSAFPNPSPQYLQATREFTQRNEGRYP